MERLAFEEGEGEGEEGGGGGEKNSSTRLTGKATSGIGSLFIRDGRFPYGTIPTWANRR
jgi:hypothetical protein